MTHLKQEEVKDILMGGDLTPVSTQSRRVGDVQRQDGEGHEQAVNVRTHDKHGRELVSSTTSPYERQPAFSRTDWRIRALSASNHYLRDCRIVQSIDRSCGNIPVPRNIVKKFIFISDLRCQIGAYMYGLESKENIQSREVRSFVITPQ